MSKFARIHAPGGPEALVIDDLPVPEPGPGQARVRHTAIGLNYLDVYHRYGWYPLPIPLPATLGTEGAGVVVSVGPGVENVKEGDRVAYAAMPPGSYCEERVIAADRLIKIPEGKSDEEAACIMQKGIQTWNLLTMTHEAKPGETFLFHAAAGGVGLMFGQWAKHLGCRTIGTVGSEDKVAAAKEAGYDEVIVTSKDDWVAKTKELTGGKGVDVAFDAVGKDTFLKSMDTIRPRGLMVLFGNSSGMVEPFNPAMLTAKGNLYLTRPAVFMIIGPPPVYAKGMTAVMDMWKKGVLKPKVGQKWKLDDVVEAHRVMESRKTIGASILTV